MIKLTHCINMGCGRILREVTDKLSYIHQQVEVVDIPVTLLYCPGCGKKYMTESAYETLDNKLKELHGIK